MRTEKDLENSALQPVHLFSRFTHVLLILVRDPGVTIREISIVLDVTERTVHRILNQLEMQGFVRIERQGRRNKYVVVDQAESALRFENGCKVNEVIKLALGHQKSERKVKNHE